MVAETVEALSFPSALAWRIDREVALIVQKESPIEDDTDAKEHVAVRMRDRLESLLLCASINISRRTTTLTRTVRNILTSRQKCRWRLGASQAIFGRFVQRLGVTRAAPSDLWLLRRTASIEGLFDFCSQEDKLRTNT
jgi:hypothetical protein